MKIVIKNIAELIQTEEFPRKWVAGKDMSHINTIKDAFVEVENGIITLFGSMEDWAGIEDWNNTEIIDAEGGMVFPTYCDSHTHLVFAASREGEFVDRINGLSYAEIAEKGGGRMMWRRGKERREVGREKDEREKAEAEKADAEKAEKAEAEKDADAKKDD